MSTNIPTIIVTRHPALVQYLHEQGIAPRESKVIAHASVEDVRGRRVVGVLPHHLSSLAASVVEVPLHVPPERRGVELSLEQVRQYAGPAAEYVVRPAALVRLAAAELRADIHSISAAGQHGLSYDLTREGEAALRFLAGEDPPPAEVSELDRALVEEEIALHGAPWADLP